MTASPITSHLSRRRLLQVGGASLLGLSLPRLLAADARRIRSVRADSCIVVFLNGGPSHLDMWDMKPHAPAEVRGPFKAVASSLPGVPLCEHLPRLARQVHRTTIVRSVHHSVNNAHAAAVYAAMTGHDRGELGGGARPTDNPAIGSVVSLLRPPGRPVVGYVSMPYITQEGAGGPPQPGFFGGVLGRTRDPLFVLRDPNLDNFSLPELGPGPGVDRGRLDDRRRLLEAIPRVQSASMREMAGFQGRAFDLLASPATQQAFQIEREPLPLRERYGRNIYGQSVLLARRLIEAGTRVACISWAPDANATWDTHGQNFVKLQGTLLPQLDLAVSALLDDLHERGLLERTLVVVMGEFGRTPKINPAAGRDHWNFCYGLMLAGGGIRPGYVHGASDRIGAHPSLNPVTPGDIVATIYHCLGIEPDTEIRDRLARPFVLVPSGNVIHDLLT
ncbi:MAG: DUF1501 domain-containing protein [Gemmataceae bacterium]